MTQKQSTLALLVGAIVLFGALAALSVKSSRDEELKKAADEKAAQLNAFDTTQVDWVKVTAKGQTTELQKTGTNWEITSPIRAPADTGVLDGLVGRLYDMKSKTPVEEHATDLAKYGLVTPQADVEVKGPGVDVHLLFGDANGFNRTEYVKRASDGAVFLVEGSNAPLEKGTFDLRDKRVHPFDPKEVTALEVKSPDGDYTLVRDAQSWKLTRPLAENADEGVVNQLLATLGGLRSIAIPEEQAADLSKYGLDAPTHSVAVVLNGKPVSYLFGAPKGKERDELFAKASTGPAIYKLLANALAPLKQTPLTLEDKTVLKFDIDAVAAMTFVAGDGSTILVQRKRADAGGVDSWSQLSPKSGEGKAWKIGGLMHNLAELRAAKVDGSPSDLQPYGLATPKKRVKVQDNRGGVIAELAVGGEGEGNDYVQAANDSRVFEVESFKLANLPDTADDLLNVPVDGG